MKKEVHESEEHHSLKIVEMKCDDCQELHECSRIKDTFFWVCIDCGFRRLTGI